MEKAAGILALTVLTIALFGFSYSFFNMGESGFITLLLAVGGGIMAIATVGYVFTGSGKQK